MTASLYCGDSLTILRTLPDGVARCCVTSPPYWGLRDYGEAGQLGLEPTPDAYVANMVAVFREVWRVLAEDGTLWLNLGDSYATNPSNGRGGESGVQGGIAHRSGIDKTGLGLKTKDLVGIPWLVARALQSPYYAGRITPERDRAWIAGIVDGEGSISGFHHIRSDDGSPRTGLNLFVTNSSERIIEECHRIWPASRAEHIRPGEGHLGKRAVWRWIVNGTENKTLFLREVYPYLVGKRKQAIVGYNLLLLVAVAKRMGQTAQRDSEREKRLALVDMVKALNKGENLDIPSWMIAPPSATEPGWYLRSDIIWSKPNPMPESVKDRPTKAHEYVFLLSKRERYYYDAASIAEDAVSESAAKFTDGSPDKQRGHSRRHAGFNGRYAEKIAAEGIPTQRNARSVWSIATQPYPEAHFATFPEELARRCILAGSAPGDTVLDPFGGSGTVASVATGNGRSAIHIDLNPRYIEMAQRRIGPMLCEALP